jgi:transcription termination factor Rho
MNLTEIKIKPINELVDIATELGLEDVGRLKKQEIILGFLNTKLPRVWTFMVVEF